MVSTVLLLLIKLPLILHLASLRVIVGATAKKQKKKKQSTEGNNPWREDANLFSLHFTDQYCHHTDN